MPKANGNFAVEGYRATVGMGQKSVMLRSLLAIWPGLIDLFRLENPLLDPQVLRQLDETFKWRLLIQGTLCLLSLCLLIIILHGNLIPPHTHSKSGTIQKSY